MKFTAWGGPSKKFLYPGHGRLCPGYHYRQRTIRPLHPLEIAAFYVIGATTRLALVSAPLRPVLARFTAWIIMTCRHEGNRSAGSRYTCRSRQMKMVLRKLPAGRAALHGWLCACCAGCAIMPRCGRTVSSTEVAHEALNLLNVDPLGLDEVDRRVLRTIIEKYQAVRSD